MKTAEQSALQEIDRLPAAAGWPMQYICRPDLRGARAAYLLYLDDKAAGIIEATRNGARAGATDDVRHAQAGGNRA